MKAEIQVLWNQAKAMAAGDAARRIALVVSEDDEDDEMTGKAKELSTEEVEEILETANDVLEAAGVVAWKQAFPTQQFCNDFLKKQFADLSAAKKEELMKEAQADLAAAVAEFKKIQDRPISKNPADRQK